MSGYSSKAEVMSVIKATLVRDGYDPADFNLSGIMRDAFANGQPIYGYRDKGEGAWLSAVAAHRRNRPAPTAIWNYYRSEVSDMVTRSEVNRESHNRRHRQEHQNEGYRVKITGHGSAETKWLGLNRSQLERITEILAERD